MPDGLKIDAIQQRQGVQWPESADSKTLSGLSNLPLPQKSDDYYKNSIQSFEEDKKVLPYTAKTTSLFSVKGIFTSILEFFGWKTEAPEAAKSQESPVEAPGNRPRIDPPKVEESTKRMNSLWEEFIRENGKRSNGIDEEFRNPDPKKGDALIMALLVALINQSRKHREMDGVFAAEQAQDYQESIAETQKRKAEIYEKMEKLAKNSAFYAKLDPIFQGGAMVGVALTGIATIAGAATIASGGTLSPLLAVVGICTGISTGLSAINSFMRNWNNIDHEKNQGESEKIKGDQTILQFEIRLTMDQVKQAMKDVSANIESLTKTLEMMQENQSMFR